MSSAAADAELLSWLSELKLDRYADALVGGGYNTMTAVSSLTAEKLTSLGITMAGHRNRLLNNLPPSSQPASVPQPQAPPPRPGPKPLSTTSSSLPVTTATATTTTAATTTTDSAASAAASTAAATSAAAPTLDDFGLDDVLGDLSTMIGELDNNNSSSSSGSGSSSSGSGSSSATAAKTTAASALGSAPLTTLVTPAAAVAASELDSLLDDLCNFGADINTAVPATTTTTATATTSRNVPAVVELKAANAAIPPAAAVTTTLTPANNNSSSSSSSSSRKGAAATVSAAAAAAAATTTVRMPGSIVELVAANASADAAVPPLPPKYGSKSSSSEALTSGGDGGDTPANAAEAAGTEAESSSSAASAASFAAAEVRATMRKPKNAEEVAEHLDKLRKRLSDTGKIGQNELDAMMKEEKIRLAMEKMAAASNVELVIKVFLDEYNSKTQSVESAQSIQEVVGRFVLKNRLEDNPNWALVEVLPELGVRRVLEDHESIGDVYNNWPPVCNYRLVLETFAPKYELFTAPDKYFPAHLRADLGSSGSARTERAKLILLQEYFSNTTRVPDIKGYLHEREGTSKKWKKRFFMLRASGVYYSVKGESEAPADLRCYANFETHDAYISLDGEPGAAPRTKAPAPFVLVFKPRTRRQSVEPSQLKAVCCLDEQTLNVWHAGVRLARHGSKLKENYDAMQRKFKALHEIGEVNRDVLLRDNTRRAGAVHETNKELIKQWKSHRADAGNPKISAATGVEFDDLSEFDGDASLAKYPWYHGNISRNVAQHLAECHGMADGAFLVRNSTSHPGDYVLSMCVSGSLRHFHIRKGRDGLFHIDSGQGFAALPKLVAHYRGPDDRLPTRLARDIQRV